MGRPVLVLYTEAAEITPEVITAMTEAGYLPVKVGARDAVQILDVPMSSCADDIDAITRAALTAVKGHATHSAESAVATEFGRVLAGLLLAKPKIADPR